MADYNSDRTGSNIDAVLDKADNLTQAAVGVGGNVGIGRTPSSHRLEIGGELKLTGLSDEGIDLYSLNSYRASIVKNDNALSFCNSTDNNRVERARIDSSGNLLVGTTDNNTVGVVSTTGDAKFKVDGTVGHIAFGRSGNEIVFSRPSANYISAIEPDANLKFSTNKQVTFSRTDGSDGDITVFQKDGATVGSMGSHSGGGLYLYSNSGSGSGLALRSNTVAPSGTTGGHRDAALDLGLSASRFKDLYLSGGVITSSDYRLKEDVQPMQSYADTIRQMNLVNFAWKDSGEREDGFIAHELQALFPSAVRGDKDAIDEDGNEQYQGVDPLKLIPVLTKALQEALERIETLENK